MNLPSVPEIRPANLPDELPVVRALLREYAASLDFDAGARRFDKELVSPSGPYAPPLGALLLAWRGGAATGCVALRRLASPSTCELKRLYVRPGERGAGLGRGLVEAVLDEARRLGYARVRLDTLPLMEAAIALYRSLGFVPIPAYCKTPATPGALFMELRLDARTSRFPPPAGSSPR